MLPELAHNIQVKRTGDLTTLTLNNVSLSDGGSYNCIDKLGMGEMASAELIVLGTYYTLDACTNILKT